MYLNFVVVALYFVATCHCYFVTVPVEIIPYRRTDQKRNKQGYMHGSQNSTWKKGVIRWAEGRLPCSQQNCICIPSTYDL